MQQKFLNGCGIWAGLDVAGGLGIWFQLCCLVAAVSPVLISRLQHTSDAVAGHILVGGLIMSRLGLWLFDLSVNQMLQERVNKEEIGEQQPHLASLINLEIRSS